jgi:hypothetical protein
MESFGTIVRLKLCSFEDKALSHAGSNQKLHPSRAIRIRQNAARLSQESDEGYGRVGGKSGNGKCGSTFGLKGKLLAPLVLAGLHKAFRRRAFCTPCSKCQCQPYHRENCGRIDANDEQRSSEAKPVWTGCQSLADQCTKVRRTFGGWPAG